VDLLNLLHSWICSSGRWKQTVADRLLPWALKDVNLGSNVLEVGPGYGATTEVLRGQVDQLTCVEVDPVLAAGLRKKSLGPNVTILCEDATAMSLGDATFDGAVCFTMLHHVPSASLQDRLLKEIARVLRPRGIFAGSDSVDSRLFRLLHVFDTLVIVDPAKFESRLNAAGFDDVKIDIAPRVFKFSARKPLLTA
jgi:SAM-dependent methyltransferase